MIPKENQVAETRSTDGARSLRYSYTVVLFVLAVLALLAIVNHEFLIRTMPNKDEVVLAVIRYVQVLEAIIFLFTVTVGVLRTYRSPLAWPTTAAVSILLAIWVPFGTAAFIYWVGWIRKDERPRASNALSGRSEASQ